MYSRQILLGVFTFGFIVTGAYAANIPLNSATATFDQGAPYNIGSSLDGTPVDGDSGWAVFGGQTVNQAAMWRATTAASTTSGFVFTLPQNYGDGTDPHRLQQFRLSMTTDAVPSLGGNWSQVSPARIFGSGTTLSNLGNNIIGATGGGQVTYQAYVPGIFTGVTAFRLEALTGANGQLGASNNGNFVLSQFRVDTSAGFNWAAWKQVTGSAPSYMNAAGGGFSYPNFLTDENLGTINHPLAAGPSPFFYTVDLGGNIDLDSLQLFGRNDGCCPERFYDYRVNILNDAQVSVWQGDFHTTDPTNGRMDTITEGLGTGLFEGRFVRITNLSNTQYSPQIAEVKAFGAVVPEPASGALLLLAGGLLARRRRG